MSVSAPQDRWARIKQLFAEALEHAPDAREAFVAAASANDPDLAREVGELLRAHAIDDRFIEQPAADHLGWAREATAPDWTGRRIGPYRVVAEAGRGGLSRVFRAVREHGDVEQQVAIKLLHAGLGTDALLERFRAERRLLARLSHPNIAHFLDAGATHEGVPYLVMEFVEGEPIDAWCEARGLGLEARLDLFRALCGAVHHVHQNLMVHGDLKGGNVLVTRDGVVKLLDFGIAKLLDPAAGDTAAPATLLMMTPEYASPEQVRGEALTTASDVYSLGALLYRLLTGAVPGTRGGEPSLHPARSVDGPLAPSVAAARTGGAYAAFAPALRAELDAVLLKALKPEPRERYGSAQQFADDLQRYLRGLPVEARPDSATYRIAKFARRHAAATTATALFVVALVGGIAAALWQAHVARAERERAERHFQSVRQLSATFLGDVYDAVARIPGSTEARKLLGDKSLEYLVALEGDAATSPELRRDLGKAWERLGDVQGAYIDPNLGDRGKAAESYRRSLAIREALVREQPTLQHRTDLLRGQVVLGELLVSDDAFEAARPVVRDGIVNAEAVLAAGAVGTDRRAAVGAYLNHGSLERADGRLDAAVASLERALAIAESMATADPRDRTARRMVGLVHGRIGELHLHGTGRLEDALGYYRRAYAIFDALVREVPDEVELQRGRAYARATIGHLLVQLRRPREALRELEPELVVLDRSRRADPADVVAPLALGAVLNLVGECRLQLGEYDAAHARFTEASKYLPPELAQASADVRVLLAQMLAGRAQAEAGQARALTGGARAARLAEARDGARRAIELLEPIAERGNVVFEARRRLEQARGVLGETPVERGRGPAVGSAAIAAKE